MSADLNHKNNILYKYKIYSILSYLIVLLNNEDNMWRQQMQKGGSQQQMKTRMGVKNVFLTEKRKTIFSESDLLLLSGAKNVGWGGS